MPHDLVIRNGFVVDGTGLASYRADVGIDGGLITEIGRIGRRATREIDADGHVVTPGFIDGHTHMDAQVFWDDIGSSICWHGVTTAVMGHCGFTLAPSSKELSALVVRNLERAEDISGVAMAAGITWTWTTFAEYLDAVDALPKGINYAANVGHSALRTFVMGERAFLDVATSDDIAAMAAELRSAISAGAWGFTSSRTQHHQTSDDRPVASRLAAWDEVAALVQVMSELGTGIFQMAQDPPGPGERENWEGRMMALAALGRPIAMAVGGPTGPLNMVLLDKIAAAGGNAFGMTHCRGIGSLSSFGTTLPFDGLAEWQAVRALPPAEQQRQLADPTVRAALVQAAHHGAYKEGIGAEARKPDFDRMRVLDHPLPPNPTVAELAARRGLDPVELMIDLAVETFDTLYAQTFAAFDHDQVKAAMLHPRTVTGFSDAGAHVSQMSDASLPSHLLGHWVRQRQDFTLEEAVRMLTLEPARTWGFHDRGLIREGLVADLNVLDPETVSPDLPEIVNDLPGGQRRLRQTATGYLGTVVAGRVVHERGQHTGELPGTLIRGPLASRR